MPICLNRWITGCLVSALALAVMIGQTTEAQSSRSAPVMNRSDAKVTQVKTVSAKPERVEVYPSEVKLESRRAFRQFVVTGYYGGVPYDLTSRTLFRLANEKTARMSGSRVAAVGDGKTVVMVNCDGVSAAVPVMVSNTGKPDPIDFKFETIPVLTKQGCATGSCHGSPHGKGGFSLSLFGYDPQIDRISMTHDGFSRRINVMSPTDSLMLKKPLLEIPHVGGKRLRRTDAAYPILKDWIFEGAHSDLPKVECEHIVVTPNSSRVLHAPFLKQQLNVTAYFTDGSVRDVTSIATYESSHPNVASVDANGMITGVGRGQAAISARYLDKLQSIYITNVVDIPHFAWNSPLENNIIDHLVDAKLKQLQYLPSGTCSDAVFLRRVSLDLTGLLPTAEQTRRFLKDGSSDKRARYIDSLLQSEEYARFWALKQADLMRLNPNRLKEGRADLFAHWLVDSVRSNMPFDRFARETLTAQGDTEKVAAANYFMAIPTMEERTEMTAQLFMGSRVECAHCHNHPFENWTQRDYFRIGAVFARTQVENGTVKVVSGGETKHPTTGETMIPWGQAADKISDQEDRRAVFADWLTKPDNPLFARVEVNRLWAELMGRGIVEPVDDFRSSNPPSNVPLLDALAQEFVKSGYDRKHVVRLICNSRTYQRETKSNPFNETDETLFSHARVHLLTAEQLKDAIGFTTRVLEPTAGLPAKLQAVQAKISDRTMALETDYPKWLEEKTREAIQRSQSAKNSAGSGTKRKRSQDNVFHPENLLIIPVERRTEAQNQQLHAYYLQQDSALRELRQQHSQIENRMEYATQRPYPELSSFTETFGQPARETACTCERQHSPTLLQALELLNGGTAYQMAQSGAGRYEKFDNDRLIEELYLSALCRLPSEKERTTAKLYLAKRPDRHAAVMDLVWTILNTQEFLFQH